MGKVEPKSAAVPKYKPVNVSLPTEKSEPVREIDRYSHFWYGKQGIGKTSLTAQFPDSFHLMFEPGAKDESIYQATPENWAEVEEYTRLLTSDERFKYVVVDTADLMFYMASRKVCKDAGVDSLKDVGFGDGYEKAGNLFRDVLIRIHRRKGLIVLAHDKEKMKKSDSEPDYTVPSTMRTGANVLGKWCDVTGHYYIKSNGKRYMRIRQPINADVKCRPKNHFLYTDGTRIIEIPMGDSEEEAHKNYVDAFYNRLENPKNSNSNSNSNTTRFKFK